MALLNLGTKQINLYDPWESYTIVGLDKDANYLLEIQMTATNPDQVYSYFAFRWFREIINSRIGYSLPSSRIFYDSNRQAANVFISNLFEGSTVTTFQVKRFPLFWEPTRASDVNVTLSIDPDRKA